MGTETLNSYITTGITLTAAGAYNYPFTITAAGTLSTAAQYAVYSQVYAPFLLNQGTIADTYRSGDGVYFQDGGTVNNSGSLALISSPLTGVLVIGATGTVANDGTISAGAGVVLQGGGIIANTGPASLIFGSGGGGSFGDGVTVFNAASTIVNAGTINGANAGVQLNFYGTVANTGTLSRISSAHNGVAVKGAAVESTITNAGTISGGSGAGIYLFDSPATITNAGTISGGQYGVEVKNDPANQTAPVTVINAGTIAGGSAALSLQSAGGHNRVVAESGAVFIGAVSAAGAHNILELAGTGTTVASIGGQFSGFATIAFDPGAAWTISGAEAALDAAAFTGVTLGDVIDVTGFAATAASYVAGSGLELTSASGGFLLAMSKSGGVFSITPDGNGGTDVEFGIRTLSTAITTGITLTAAGPDVSPFTVTPSGTINSTSYGVFSTLPAAYLLNEGTISRVKVGNAVVFKDGGTVVNAGTIVNSGSVVTGHLIQHAGVVIDGASGAVFNTGSIIGSAADSYVPPGGGSLITNADDGVYLQSSGMVTNTGRSALISGYYYGVFANSAGTVLNSGTILGQHHSGVLFQDGGVVANTASYAMIYGGEAAVSIQAGVGTVLNSGTIIGHGLYSVALVGGGTVINSGAITGARESVDFQGEVGTLINSGTIAGVRDGVDLTNGGGAVTNSGTIAGGADGVQILVEASSESGMCTLVNTGTILGQTDGVFLSGGTLTNGGTIAGGVDAVYAEFSGLTLNALASGVFDGAVFEKAGGGVINLAGSAAGALEMAGSFSGFSAINFGPAAWTLEGTAAELADGQTITGFTLGDTIDLSGFAATSASYTAGVGLVLTSAAASLVLSFSGGGGEFAITPDGTGGTEILFGTHTLATYSATGITLTAAGPDFSPFTITSAGTINTGGDGVQSPLSGAYLLNAGTIIAGQYGVFQVGTVVNTGTISGGDGKNDAGIAYSATITNQGRSALITGLDGLAVPSGASPETVTNTGTIEGQDNGLLLDAADNSEFVDNSAAYAVIYGGAGTGVQFAGKTATGTLINAGTILSRAGDGVRLKDSGTVTNSGTIAGGADAIYGNAAGFTLNALSGGVFYGAVFDKAGGGVLNLAGYAPGALEMGGSFSGFSAINFGPAAWTLEGTASELAGGQAINGFSAGDTIDLSGFAATGARYTAGVGLVLTSAASSELLKISGLDLYSIEADGNGGTEIIFGTHTLAAYNSSGITLTEGGPYLSPFTVTTAGTVESGAAATGVYGALPAAYLLNEGSISGGPPAVQFSDGGTVVNGAGAVIYGVNTGVGVDSAAGTVTNAGSISSGGLYGVYLQQGGSITNTGGGAVIYGGNDGVFVKYAAPGYVTNAGTIQGARTDGVYLGDGGSVRNAGTISGGDVGVYVTSEAGVAGTVVNSGTIAGGIYAVQFNGNNPNLLVVDPGAVFLGNVAATQPGSTLELASGTGSLAGLGVSFAGFTQITVDAGASWALEGGTVQAGATLTDDGTLTAAGLENDGVITLDPSTLTVAGSLTGTGVVTISAGSTLEVTGDISAGQTIMFGPGAVLEITDTAAIDGTLSGAGTIDITDLAFANFLSASFSSISDLLGITYSTGTLELHGNFAGDSISKAQDAAGNLELVLCYLHGTRILTPEGLVAVEDLAIGDAVVTRFGGIQKIKWLGRQSYAPEFIANNPDKWPVCIQAGALEEGVPARDLYVSPGHSMLLGGVLVLASTLVNGLTITQTRPETALNYVQIDLGYHDCVIAEGAWSETFADAPGLRAQFHNAAEFYALYPEEPPPDALRLCAPRPERGAKLAAAFAPVLRRMG